MQFEEEYWSNRYQQGLTQWDIGKVSKPIQDYVDQLKNKEIKILIPGCGNGYEAAYCFELGFKNTYVIDVATEPLEKLLEQHPAFPQSNAIHGDFFKLEGIFDLIIEQTFFCALHPSLREAYVIKMRQLLSENGKLIGVLFDDKLNEDKPPFGGSKGEYVGIFSKYLTIQKMERCFNSIKPRMGRELFFKLLKQ